MKQLTLFDLFDEAESLQSAEKAVWEKQSNLSSNITASNEISISSKQAEPQKYISSPMYLQFLSIKKQYPDALLLFRCGDFYEAYEQDAQDATKILGITLTHRGTMPMCGFPYHALDTYLPRLVRAGRRVAICDQLDAPTAKQLVKRPTSLVSNL